MKRNKNLDIHTAKIGGKVYGEKNWCFAETEGGD